METRLVPDAPGAWLVYDLGTLVFAVPPELRAVADALAARSPARLADVLATWDASGVGVASFAVLDAGGDGLHLALRGPATLAAGTETLTGLDAEPWLERFIPGVTVARLTVPGGEWTLTLTPAVATPVAPVSASTEVPEISLPRPAPLAPPPPLGLAEPPRPTRPERTLSLELPDGSREPLDTVVLVGRAPSAPADGPAIRLVRLEGDGDVSRTHARVEVEGGTVVVTDLASRNGTTVRIPGRPAQRLRDGEPTPVLVGTVIDFGGGHELTVRED